MSDTPIKDALEKARDALSTYQYAGFGNSTNYRAQADAYDKAVEALPKIDAALAALAQQQEWRPIETAPEEGVFLVYMPDETMKFQVARWRPNVKVIGNVFAFDLTKPSHWRPLPPPPTEGDSNA